MSAFICLMSNYTHSHFIFWKNQKISKEPGLNFVPCSQRRFGNIKRHVNNGAGDGTEVSFNIMKYCRVLDLVKHKDFLRWYFCKLKKQHNYSLKLGEVMGSETVSRCD